MPAKFVNNFLYEDLTYKIRGCIFTVYNTLGYGHKENIYQKSLAAEFKLKNIPFEQEKALNIIYKNNKIGVYKPDFLIDNKIVLEIKAVPLLSKTFEVQLTNYLKATGYKLGLLVNFGSSKLIIKRRIWSPKHQWESALNQRKSVVT